MRRMVPMSEGRSVCHCLFQAGGNARCDANGRWMGWAIWSISWLTKSCAGGTPSHSDRDSTIDSAVGDVAYAATDIPVRRRDRAVGYTHEVFVRRPMDRAARPARSMLCRSWVELHGRILRNGRYKGMAQTPSSQPAQKQVTPQQTGFSQVSNRGTGEGQGHAMSVLLSWHEKVVDCQNDDAGRVLIFFLQLVEIAGPGSIVRVMSDRRTV